MASKTNTRPKHQNTNNNHHHQNARTTVKTHGDQTSASLKISCSKNHIMTNNDRSQSTRTMSIRQQHNHQTTQTNNDCLKSTVLPESNIAIIMFFTMSITATTMTILRINKTNSRKQRQICRKRIYPMGKLHLPTRSLPSIRTQSCLAQLETTLSHVPCQWPISGCTTNSRAAARQHLKNYQQT